MSNAPNPVVPVCGVGAAELSLIEACRTNRNSSRWLLLSKRRPGACTFSTQRRASRTTATDGATCVAGAVPAAAGTIDVKRRNDARRNATAGRIRSWPAQGFLFALVREQIPVLVASIGENAVRAPVGSLRLRVVEPRAPSISSASHPLARRESTLHGSPLYKPSNMRTSVGTPLTASMRNSGAGCAKKRAHAGAVTTSVAPGGTGNLASSFAWAVHGSTDRGFAGD